MPDQRSDAASEVAPPAPDLRVEIEVEQGERVGVIRLKPLAPRTGDGRPRLAGPFGRHLEQWADLRAATAARARLSGWSGALGLAGGSWGPLSLVCVPGDLDTVRAAAEALLAGDDGPVRSYLRSPPRLPHGEPWSAPLEGEGWATR
jgi:hypothetical protein